MSDTWVGTRIRKGEREGAVIIDSNGFKRLLVVEFDDGTREDILLNNMGPDAPQVHDYEWWNITGPLANQWLRF